MGFLHGQRLCFVDGWVGEGAKPRAALFIMIFSDFGQCCCGGETGGRRRRGRKQQAGTAAAVLVAVFLGERKNNNKRGPGGEEVTLLAGLLRSIVLPGAGSLLTPTAALGLHVVLVPP